MNAARAIATRIVRVYAHHRYALLFFSLLATIAVGPLLQAAGANVHLIEFLLAVNLLAAVYPGVVLTRRRPILLYVLGAALLLRWVTLRMGLRELSELSLAMWTAIAALAAVRSLRFAMSSVQVHGEHLYAALSTYLLAGVFWAIAYVALESQAPGSLQMGGATMSSFDFPDAIYFSFVTLATLGYGDVLPVGSIARGLAIFEAIVGQLYLAVMVARLVGLRTMTEGPPEPH